MYWLIGTKLKKASFHLSVEIIVYSYVFIHFKPVKKNIFWYGNSFHLELVRGLYEEEIIVNVTIPIDIIGTERVIGWNIYFIYFCSHHQNTLNKPKK